VVCQTPFFSDNTLSKRSSTHFLSETEKADEIFTYHRGKKKKILSQNVEASGALFSVWFSSHFQQRGAVFHSVHHMLSLLISNKCTKDENFKSYTSNGFLFEYLTGQQYVLCLTVQLQLNLLLVCKQEEKCLNVCNRHLHL